VPGLRRQPEADDVDRGRVVASGQMTRGDLRAREPVVVMLVVPAAWEDGGNAVLQVWGGSTVRGRER